MNWLQQKPDITWSELIASTIVGMSFGILLLRFVIDPLHAKWEKHKADKFWREADINAARHQEMLRLIDKAVQEAMKNQFPQVGAHAQYLPWDDDASKHGVY